MRTKTKDAVYQETPEQSNTLICPVCKKEFEPDENTKFIISGGYTCGSKCFVEEAKRRDELKKREAEIKEMNKQKEAEVEDNNIKKKRGRKKKNEGNKE